jgi:menaquinone-dependent protoporphyrinogen IX oxidase
MKTRSLLLCALFAFSVVLTLNIFSPAKAQDQNNRMRVPENEMKAAKAVEAAPDLNTKLASAQDFVQKYPKSLARKQVADYLVSQIAEVKDANEELALAQKFQTAFTEEAEVKTVKPIIIDAYIRLNRFDDAFSEGASLLAKNPEEIQILVDLAITGTEQAKQRNPKYVTQSRQYGTKAIELIEADKKPADMDAEGWSRFKSKLPQLYQEMAIIALLQQNAAESQSNVEKAIKLNPSDPFNYVLLGSLTNDEYQRVAQSHKGMPDGKAKDDMFKKATELLDKVIDSYAHAVALSEGKSGYEKLHSQVLEDLTAYYKYRHNNSTEGLQQLIDKYKMPAKP